MLSNIIKPFRSLYLWYMKALETKPYTVSSLTAGVLGGFGDGIS